jgi:predicted transcriptional regulator
MKAATPDPNLLRLAADIVAAHVGHNVVAADALPDLIRAVYAALSSVDTRADIAARPVPAVPVQKSVFPGYIVCLEDGKRLKMLKRHPQTAYGMTPDDYRAKWGLPAGYPMVAPDYATQRSKLAEAAGLGGKRVQPAPVAAEVPVQKIAAGVSGKKKRHGKKAAPRSGEAAPI